MKTRSKLEMGWSIVALVSLFCFTEAHAQSTTRGSQPAIAGPYGSTSQASMALRGYSPVSLRDNRQWERGRNEFRVVFDGAVYLLANERQMQVFRAAPHKYVPVLGGDCAVHYVQTGGRKPGILRHGVVYDNRLFFFSSPEHKQSFVDDPTHYANADLALQGNCPVCIVEMNKPMPGQPELAVVFEGRRYLFPGAQQREMFLAQPLKYAVAAHAVAGDSVEIENTPASDGSGSIADADAPASNQTVGSGSDLKNNPGSHSKVLPDGQTLPLAMAGYCPVTLLEGNRWVRGAPEYSAVHDDHRYLFASAAERAQFEQNPTKYVPALGGDCVVCQKELGQRIEGSIYYAVIHHDRVYLFPSAQQKDAFKSNPEAYAQVDLALDGNCPVCRVDMAQEVPGKPELTAWYNGLRFQFAGQEQLETFQAAPKKYAVADDAAKRSGSSSIEPE